MKIQQQLQGLCLWKKSEVSHCPEMPGQAGASVAETSLEGQDGGNYLLVFWSPLWADQPAISELTTGPSRAPSLNTLTRISALTWLRIASVHSRTRLCAVGKGASPQNRYLKCASTCTHTTTLSCIYTLKTTQGTLVSGGRFQAFLVQKRVSV